MSSRPDVSQDLNCRLLFLAASVNVGWAAVVKDWGPRSTASNEVPTRSLLLGPSPGWKHLCISAFTSYRRKDHTNSWPLHYHALFCIVSISLYSVLNVRRPSLWLWLREPSFEALPRTGIITLTITVPLVIIPDLIVTKTTPLAASTPARRQVTHNFSYFLS